MAAVEENSAVGYGEMYQCIQNIKRVDEKCLLCRYYLNSLLV